MNLLNKPHYKILIIGKTGAGKSTAINMIVNLIFNHKYEDDRAIAIT
jgi:predicted GTPase